MSTATSLTHASLTHDWHDVLTSTELDIRRWRRARPDLFGGSTTADDVLTAIRHHSDPVLGFLLAEHQLEHPQAGRLVWHSMLPKMRVMAGRDALADFADYTGHLWLRLCTYPLAARQHRIAANLALDTLKAVKSEQVRWHTVGEVDGAAAAAPQPADEVTAQRVISLARELGLIDAATQHLLRTVYAEGQQGQAAAEALGLPRTTVRYRCSRVLRRLRDHSEELLEA